MLAVFSKWVGKKEGTRQAQKQRRWYERRVSIKQAQRKRKQSRDKKKKETKEDSSI